MFSSGLSWASSRLGSFFLFFFCFHVEPTITVQISEYAPVFLLALTVSERERERESWRELFLVLFSVR